MRDQNLILIRPQLNLPSLSSTTAPLPTLESFQNDSLRPILKMQHDLLLLIWQNHLVKQLKNVVPMGTTRQISEFIAQTVKSDMKLKNKLLGTLIGHFTLAEFAFFADNENELMRRMTDLLVQRLMSTV